MINKENIFILSLEHKPVNAISLDKKDNHIPLQKQYISDCEAGIVDNWCGLEKPFQTGQDTPSG